MSLALLCPPLVRAVRRVGSLRRVALAQALPALLLVSTGATAQVALSALDTPYQQSFDTLHATGSAPWSNNAMLTGWYHARSGSGTVTMVVADIGTGTGGALYSYGTAGSTDRALGSLASNAAGDFFWGVRLLNSTGTTITSLDVAYTGEQWRNAGSAVVAQTAAFSYLVGSPTVSGSLAEFQLPGTAVTDLDFTSPVIGGAARELIGNVAPNRTARTFTITGLSMAPGTEVMLRWSDPNHSGADHGLSIDDLSVTPHGASNLPGLSIGDVSMSEGNAGGTTFTFTVSLSAPAPPTGVTFDIATADGSAIAPTDYVSQGFFAQTIPAGSSSYSFNVSVAGDTLPELDENFLVSVSNIVGASAIDAQGNGTIVNDDAVPNLGIHDIQGSGSATPIPVATLVAVEGVVTASFQAAGKLSGFFLQEESADADADPMTSEGVFVFCQACPVVVAEGQRVRVTGTASERFGMTQINATSAAAVVITDAGNRLADITTVPVALPIAGDVNAFYEAIEGMRVTFTDTLTVSEYFQLSRYGEIELFQGARPHQFTAGNAPSIAGYAAHLQELDRRRVILDDDNNAQNAALSAPNGSQAFYHPRNAGGFSVGTQGVDFFRGGDQVQSVTGVLHWSFAGLTGTDAWRIRPTAAQPVFSVVNPRPASAPSVNGAIKAASVNLLNYFTTIDTTASQDNGNCGPSGTLDCRGADSVAELNRQRERASIVLCGLNADVVGLMELENTTPTGTINDLLGAVNARCGGAHPYTFVNTGGTLGSDAIRVALIYRQGVLTPVGAAVVDLDPVHSRPPTAQTFDVVDATNAAFGQRFSVVANHFKSKGCRDATGGDLDSADGQGCYAPQRTAQANRLVTWTNASVIPGAGDPDVLLLGDFNSHAQEPPITALTAAGYSDLLTTFAGADAYSYLFDGQLGHLDYALASASLAGHVTGADAWHINADELPQLDYSDEIRDIGEAVQEKKPDGSALVPPRMLFQPASPYRASDHDPVLIGLFGGAADLSVSIVDTPDPVIAGTNLQYQISVTNNGPNTANAASWTDALPSGTHFVSLSAAAGWSCTTPAVGANGNVSCNQPSFGVGSAAFTLTVAVDASVAASTVLTHTVMASSTSDDPDTGNNSSNASTTVATSADLSVVFSDAPDTVVAGTGILYTITVTNAGPSHAASVSLSNILPTDATFLDMGAEDGWSCSTPVSNTTGTITCSRASLAPGNAIFLVVTEVALDVSAGTVLTSTLATSSTTADPNPGDESATATTTVVATPQGSLTIAPASLDFGGHDVGSTSAPLTVTLGNSGTASLNVTALSAASAPYARAGGSCASTLPITLAAGASCTLGYTFTPKGPTTFNQTLSVTANAPGSGTITLMGNGVQPMADVLLSITDERAFVQVGETLNYVITVANPAGPATATVTVSDVLPAELSDGAWTCVASGAASCADGVGDILSDVAVLPTGTSATYVYSATVQPGSATERIANSASANVAASMLDPNLANNSATDTPADIIVLFKDGFDSGTLTQALDGFGDGAGFVSARLQVNADLLAGLGIMPVAIASGDTADGRSVFTLELARFATQHVIRLSVRDADGRSERGRWHTVALDAQPLDFAWQAANAERADGYLRIAAGTVALQAVERRDNGRLLRLRIALGGDQPWLTVSAD